MTGTRKRFWKRILINISDSSSEDEAPPNKVHRIKAPPQDIEVVDFEQNPENVSGESSSKQRVDHAQNTENAPEKSSSDHIVEQNPHSAPEKSNSKRRDLKKRGHTIADNDNQVIKRRRIGLAVSFIRRNTISVFFQHVTAEFTSICMHKDASRILLHLSCLTSVPIEGTWIMHCKSSTVHVKQVIMQLLTVIEESGRNCTEVNSFAAIESMIRMSRGVLWCSFMTVTSLMWLELHDSLFVEAVKIVVQNLQSQVSSLHMAFELLNRSLLQNDTVKQGAEAAYKTVINVAFLLNVLFSKRRYHMEDLVLLAMDIALLPPLGSDAVIMKRSLYLVRSVVKSQIVCWDKCTYKIRSAIFQSCNWSKKFSSVLESGSQVHKYTLLLLTLIQSSIALPESWVDNCNDNFIRSLSSSDVKHILKRLVEHIGGNFSRQENESLLFKALDRADLIVGWFFDQVKSALLMEESDQRSKCFRGFLEDLLSLTEEFQWPAAEYTLIMLCNLMVTTLRKNKLPKKSCKFVFECLTSILVKFNNFVSFEVEAPDDFSFKMGDTRILPSLQKALLTFLVKDCQGNSLSRDWCLFYLAVWHRNDNAKEQRNDPEDWKKSGVVNRDNIRQVVKLIIGLRRTSDIKNIFKGIVLLRDLNENLLSQLVMTLVVHFVQLNAEILLEEPLLLKIISSRCDTDLAMQRRALVSCLTAYLLLRPDRFESYFEILRSYISDKAITVRKTALQGMKMIALRFYNNPKILKKLVLLLKTDGDYTESAAQLFCQLTWLEPEREKDEGVLLEDKVSLLIDMFAIISDSSFVEELFPLLFRLDEEEAKQMHQLDACAQIVDELSKRCLDRKAPHDAKTIASFKLLNLFARITPKSLVSRCVPLFLSLGRECWTDVPNVELTSAATEVLKTVLSCSQNKSSAFCFEVFMDSFKVSRIVNKNTMASGLENACLAASLQECSTILKTSYDLSLVNISLLDAVCEDSLEQICLVQRQLFMMGVISKNILNHNDDMDGPLASTMEDDFLSVLAKCFHSDVELRQTALFALDGISLLHTDAILTEHVKGVFLEVLHSDASSCLLLQVLKNICDFVRSLSEYCDTVVHRDTRQLLTNVGKSMSQSEESVRHKVKKFMKDVVDTYFESALRRYDHPDMLVRLAVLELLFVVGQNQTLTCKQIIPILETMACDPKKCIAARAQRWLSKHAENHAECVRSAVKHALPMVCGVNITTTDISSPIEGYSIDENGSVVAKLGELNSIVAKSTRNRFDIIPIVMQQFVCRQDACIYNLLFYAGNLAHFEYRKRIDVVSIISQINSLFVSKDAAVNGFKQVLVEAAGEEASSLSVHRKRVRKALKLLLLLELKSFLKQKYQIQELEVLKFESDRPYKIQITLEETTIWVSNKSRGIPIPVEASKLKFSSSMSSEEAIKDCKWKYCCGRNFSKETLMLLYKQLRKMWNKHGAPHSSQ